MIARTLVTAGIVLLSASGPAQSKDTKAKDIPYRLAVFAKTMELLAGRALLDGRHLDACVSYTLAVVHGGTKYKASLDGVKVIMVPRELDECRDRAREHMLRAQLKSRKSQTGQCACRSRGSVNSSWRAPSQTGWGPDSAGSA